VRYGILIAAEPEARTLISNSSFAWRKRPGGSLYESSTFGTLLAVSGIGKAFASARCAELCECCDAIINIGTAGSLRGDTGVVIADSYVEYDMSCGPREGVTPFCKMTAPVFSLAPDPALFERVEACCALRGIFVARGCCASADRLVNSDEEGRALVEKFGARICDMEAAAAAKVASFLYRKPFTSIKCISDLADENAISEWKKRIGVISGLISGLIEAIVCDITEFVQP